MELDPYKVQTTSSQILALRRIIEEMRNHQKEATIIFIDFKKAFDSVDRNKLFRILHASDIPEKIVKSTQTMYENTSTVVLTPKGETTNFKVNAGVLKGDPLAPYLFIIVLGYPLRTVIYDREGLTLTRHPACHLSNLDYDFTDKIQEAEFLLHKVDSAFKSSGLFFNPSKTKYMHINPSANDSVQLSGGRKIYKVEDFKYLGSDTNSQLDIIHGRKAQTCP